MPYGFLHLYPALSPLFKGQKEKSHYRIKQWQNLRKWHFIVPLFKLPQQCPPLGMALTKY
jgi:hypothetical protein